MEGFGKGRTNVEVGIEESGLRISVGTKERKIVGCLG